MKKKMDSNPRLDPLQELCPEFDSFSCKIPVYIDKEEKGVTITDNCAQEHMM